MVIPKSLVDEIIAHARHGAPEEVCGILAGPAGDGAVSELHRITNSEHSRRLYVMDSQEQLRAIMDIDDRGLDVRAVYHSHPASEPRPSETDIKLAQWPGIEFLIVSLMNPDLPSLRSWTIENGEVSEVPVTAV